MDELLEKLGCKLVRFFQDTRISAEELASVGFYETEERKVLSAISNAGDHFDDAIEFKNSRRWSADNEAETLNRERKCQRTLATAGITDEESAIAWMAEAEPRIKLARAEYEAMEQRHQDERNLFYEKMRNGQSVVTFSVGDRVRVVFTDEAIAENQGFTTRIRVVYLDGMMHLDCDGVSIYMKDSAPIQLTASTRFVEGLCNPHPAMPDYAIELTKIA